MSASSCTLPQIRGLICGSCSSSNLFFETTTAEDDEDDYDTEAREYVTVFVNGCTKASAETAPWGAGEICGRRELVRA